MLNKKPWERTAYSSVLYRYNLMFLFSSGGHLDYEGYRQWMIHESPALFDNIKFVLCIDELA